MAGAELKLVRVAGRVSTPVRCRHKAKPKYSVLASRG